MRTRFSLPVVSLALTLAVVLGTALMGLIGAAVLDTDRQWLHTSPVTALGTFLSPVFSILVLSAAVGALGWTVLFLLHRDGFHRLEWTAFRPFNYGGRSPFDISWWPK
jgi:uncharacterized membrane protein YwaF